MVNENHTKQTIAKTARLHRRRMKVWFRSWSAYAMLDIRGRKVVRRFPVMPALSASTTTVRTSRSAQAVPREKPLTSLPRTAW